MVYFNPRSRKGSDSRTGGHVRQILNFNPRSRKGSDIMSESDNCGLLYFNPRSRKGSDANTAMSNNGTAISIHAPAKGATPTDMFSLHFEKFQSTLPQRERQHFVQMAQVHPNFNPRSRKGSDLLGLVL